MAGDAGLIALVALLFFMRNGKKTTHIETHTSRYVERFGHTPKAEVQKIQVEQFEETLEENIEASTKRAKATGAIPPRTKAIAIRSFLKEKPVKVITGVYEIR